MSRLALVRRGFLMAALTGLAGCAVDNSPPTGSLTFTWSFENEDCAAAGVADVGVQIFDIDGNVLTDDHFPCSAESVTYTDFAVGDYSFALGGLSSGGSVLYTGAGPITVNAGSNQFDVNLMLAQ